MKKLRNDISDSQIVAGLCAQFAAAIPCDEREKKSIATFLEVAPSLVAPFNEHQDPTHITGSAIVVGARGVILHLHKRLNLWLQPGGHIEDGESPAQGALREAHEETGLAVEHFVAEPWLIHLDVHPGPRGHTHLDVRYLLRAPDVEPAPGQDESQNVAWFGWDEAITMADLGLAGALRVARTYVR